MDGVVESALKRDRLVIAVALGLVAAIAWLVTAQLALDMRWMIVGASGWTGGYFAAMFAMWLVMMIGMMLPSATAAVLLFAALARRRLPEAGVFAAGYVACWAAFSLLAAGAQWALAQADLLVSAMDIRVSPALAFVLFLVAGVYQLTPWKRNCLANCRSPAAYLVAHWRQGPGGAFLMGVGHGAYCVGCCWALMAMLFAVGAMNLLWVATIAALVLAEKLLPAGERIARVAALAMIAAAAVFL